MPTELDVYKPERWLDDALFRPELRSAFHGLIAQGWTDALRTLHSGEAIYTFWDYFRNAWGRDAGLRIDRLLLNPVMADRLAAANADRDVRGWDKASDHAPVWIEIKESNGKKRRTGKIANWLRQIFIRAALDATLPPMESLLAADYGDADHHRKNEPSQRFGGGARQPLRKDPAG